MDSRLNVERWSNWNPRRLWYFLRGAVSYSISIKWGNLDTVPVHRSLVNRLNETQNRPSGFDYIRLILALGVIFSHSMLLTNDNDAMMGIRPVLAMFFALILPMFFALSGFLVAGSLERSNTLITFLGLRVFRIMPALTVEVLLSALVLGPLLTTVSLAYYFSSGEFFSYFLNIFGEIHYYLPGVFLSNPVTVVNGQLWTVPWELACYIALAALAVTGIFRRRHWLVLSLVGLHVAQIGLDIIRTDRNPWVVGGSALLMSFVAGLVLYRFREKFPGHAAFVLLWPLCHCSCLAYRTVSGL
jgi:peptidoglycan/LPS O-acetylase OafA/YrhL